MSKAPNLGLLGAKLGHSFSAGYFKEKFEKLNIQGTYKNIETLDLNTCFEQELRELDGFNITIPYKEDITEFLDGLDDAAKAIGAVNTVLNKDGEYIGYNTDAPGFHNSIKPFLKFGQENALIFGRGGAAKAVAHVFESLGMNVAYLVRNPQQPDEFGYEEANAVMMNRFKVVVNTTPVGTYPDVDAEPLVDTSLFGEDHLVVDLIYNPEKTTLLKGAEAAGATVLNGLSMLKHQADLAWEIWNNQHTYL